MGFFVRSLRSQFELFESAIDSHGPHSKVDALQNLKWTARFVEECSNQLCSEDSFIEMKVFFSPALLLSFWISSGARCVVWYLKPAMLVARLGLVLLLAATSYHASITLSWWCGVGLPIIILTCCPPTLARPYSGSLLCGPSQLWSGPPTQSSTWRGPDWARLGQHKESDPLSQVRLGRRKVVWDWSRGHPCSRW